MNIKKLATFSTSPKLLKHLIFSGLLEFGPVLLFLASFRHLSIYESTTILMIATIISTVVTYHLQKRIPYLALYVASITIIFGYMTLHFHKVEFIQMRDTLYDLTCASTLILGVIFNIPFLKLIFGAVIPMTERAWVKLTYLWIGFFLLTGASNEIVRRLFSLHEWFMFKAWVVVTTSIFGIISIYLSYEPKEEK